jgi:hypothetical protein
MTLPGGGEVAVPWKALATILTTVTLLAVGAFARDVVGMIEDNRHQITQLWQSLGAANVEIAELRARMAGLIGAGR